MTANVTTGTNASSNTACPKLYGKDSVTEMLSLMFRGGRIPHTVIFEGEAGVGKTICARYFAALLICENPTDGRPCGVCRHCRRVFEKTHPDVTEPEKSGKQNIYNRETMRGICSDAYIMPNDTDRRIYIFRDFENTEPVSQNVLLKIIEDPPEGVQFIFTANGVGSLLPTILSRAVVIKVPEPSEAEARAAISETEGYSPEDIDRAVKAFHGNIGDCMGFLKGGEQLQIYEQCKQLCEALAQNSEYNFLKALAQAGESREALRKLLSFLQKNIRDAAVLSFNENAVRIGCDEAGARSIAKRLSEKRSLRVFSVIENYSEKLSYNVNTGLLAAAMTAEIFNA
jgi:DNA polymerase-3 subunit delta'